MGRALAQMPQAGALQPAEHGVVLARVQGLVARMLLQN
jgi:hypothetical protein